MEWMTKAREGSIKICPLMETHPTDRYINQLEHVSLIILQYLTFDKHDAAFLVFRKATKFIMARCCTVTLFEKYLKYQETLSSWTSCVFH
jgi:hypothetical protein